MESTDTATCSRSVAICHFGRTCHVKHEQAGRYWHGPTPTVHHKSPAVFDSGALILEEQCLVRTSTNTAKVSQNIALPLCTGTADDPTSYHSSSLESSLVMEKFVSKNWGGGHIVYLSVISASNNVF